MQEFVMADGENINVTPHNLTETTLGYLTAITNTQKKYPLILTTKNNILSPIPEKDWLSEIRAVFNFVKAKMRYTRDIYGVETVTTPERHLKNIMQNGITFGDCDDASLLLATLLASAGYRTRFVIVRTPKNPLDTYNHIYVEAQQPKTLEWLSLDATEKNREFDWKPDYIKIKKYYVGT